MKQDLLALPFCGNAYMTRFHVNCQLPPNGASVK